MCSEALIDYRNLTASLAGNTPLDPQFIEKIERLQMAAVKPIVFAGMSLEAALFDVSACLYGEDFASSVERLDPLGKFVVLAQCVYREPPSKKHVTYQHIQELIAARNQLVHYKSKRFPDSDLDVFMDRFKKDQDELRRAANRSFKTLVLLSLYFDGNIFEELRILPSFKKPEYWKELIPAALHADVYECIAAIRRALKRATSPI